MLRRASGPNMRRLFAATLTAATAVCCARGEDPQLALVQKKIASAIPGIDRSAVKLSAAPGLYQVERGQEYAYVTADGRYLIKGDMIDLETGAQITEEQRRTARLQLLAQFGRDDLIEFAPKSPRYAITVFTDVDCGFCRKLHSEMSSYYAQGIAVRYLFYPRTGPNTESFAKAEQVWCSEDRQDAMNRAKRGEALNISTACPNPVLKQWQAGETLGVNATPMIVLPDGELVRGYVPAARLAQRIASGNWKS